MIDVPPREFAVPPVEAVMLEVRAAELATRRVVGAARQRGLRLLVPLIDLTTLEGADTPGRVEQLCQLAMRPGPGLPACAAVCVHADLVPTAVAALRGSTVKVAAVAGGFPSGRSERAVRWRETELAVALGAQEIDMVLDRGAFLAGRHRDVFDDIAAIKQACGGALLKVILEVGELQTYDNVARALRIAMLAGADFVKTSTGKLPRSSTLPVVLLMLEAVREHWLQTGRRVGVKAAGGIRTAEQALRYLVLVHETCGDLWLVADGFRFGASALLDDVVRQLGR